MKSKPPFVKSLVFRSSQLSAEEGLVVLEDEAGWLYLKKLVVVEGKATPSSSVSEIEQYVGHKLSFDFSCEFDDDGRFRRDERGEIVVSRGS